MPHPPDRSRQPCDFTASRRARSLLIATALLLLASRSTRATVPMPQQIEDDVRILASSDMDGRGLLTSGLVRSADYIEMRLRSMPLIPAFGSTYRQAFNVSLEAPRAASSRIDGVRRDAWSVFPSSGAGSFRGPLVFAGYGIDHPPSDDYRGIDVRGKVVLMLRCGPREGKADAPFQRTERTETSIVDKVADAESRGAAAVIFTSGPLQQMRDELPRFQPELERRASIPVLQVKTSVAEAWLQRDGIRLTDLQTAIDRDLQPRSRQTSISVSGKIAPDPVIAGAENLAAVLPGRGPLAQETVVIGAHYDHIGYGGGESAFDKTVHAVHPGADDNASGTAAVLAVASILESRLRTAASRRTIVFAFFSAEEEMMLGSRSFVSQPPPGTSHIVAMVNLDMVGSLRDNRLVAFGSESAAEWRPLLAAHSASAGLRVAAEGDGNAYKSDQASFYAAGIPSIAFFTRYHRRYHRATDSADSINYAGEARIVEYVAAVAGDLVTGAVTPHCSNCPAGVHPAGDSRADLMPASTPDKPRKRALPYEIGGIAACLAFLTLRHLGSR